PVFVVAPKLVTVVPAFGERSQTNLVVTVAGQSTHFQAGSTVADFGAGVHVVGLSVASPTNVTATLNVDVGADLGGRIVTLSTGAEVASLAAGFTVTSGQLLVVSSQTSDSVLRYSTSNGAFHDTFVTAGAGGLARPTGLAFGP